MSIDQESFYIAVGLIVTFVGGVLLGAQLKIYEIAKDVARIREEIEGMK